MLKSKVLSLSSLCLLTLAIACGDDLEKGKAKQESKPVIPKPKKVAEVTKTEIAKSTVVSTHARTPAWELKDDKNMSAKIKFYDVHMLRADVQYGNVNYDNLELQFVEDISSKFARSYYLDNYSHFFGGNTYEFTRLPESEGFKCELVIKNYTGIALLNHEYKLTGICADQ